MPDSESIATFETSTGIPVGIPPGTGSPHRASGNPSNPRRLLWVDDSQAMLSLYKAVFESLGFEVLSTSSPEEALNHASLATTDVAILDYEMPEMDGGQLAHLIKNRRPMLPVIMYSGCMHIPQSASHCVDAFCAKAAPRAELLATIDRLSGRLCKTRGITPSSPQ
ncbi:MAG: response regulator [Candidatus Angelobacter sp.]